MICSSRHATRWHTWLATFRAPLAHLPCVTYDRQHASTLHANPRDPDGPLPHPAGGYRTRAGALPEVHGATRRPDLGGERGGEGLDLPLYVAERIAPHDQPAGIHWWPCRRPLCRAARRRGTEAPALRRARPVDRRLNADPDDGRGLESSGRLDAGTSERLFGRGTTR